MSEKLKPCPFCGSVDVASDEIEFRPDDVQGIACNACGVWMPRLAETVEELHGRWNCRPDNPDTGEPASELQEKVEAVCAHVSQVPRNQAAAIVALIDAELEKHREFFRKHMEEKLAAEREEMLEKVAEAMYEGHRVLRFAADKTYLPMWHEIEARMLGGATSGRPAASSKGGSDDG
jgi:Lar family restriction alleviation protein